MIEVPTKYQDVVQLHRFACELNLQNQTLKKHILKLQHCIQRDKRNHLDQMQKLRHYIEQCQHQIRKREERELYLMQVTQDLEQQKLNQILQKKDLEKEIQNQRQILLAQRERLVQAIQGFQKQNLALNQERRYLVKILQDFKLKQQQNRQQFLKKHDDQTKIIKQAQIEILRLKQNIQSLQRQSEANHQQLQSASKMNKNSINLPQQAQNQKRQEKQFCDKRTRDLQLQAKIKQQQQIIQILTRDTECLMHIIGSQEFYTQQSS